MDILTFEDTGPKGYDPMGGDRIEVGEGAWLIYVHAGGGRAYLANYLCQRDQDGRLGVNFGAKLLTEPANARATHETPARPNVATGEPTTRP